MRCLLLLIFGCGLVGVDSTRCDHPDVPACVLEILARLTVAPEERCAPYDRRDYPYSQSVEDSIIAHLGSVYSPYTGQHFAHKGETDIDHMIALSEAHDSGLCAAPVLTRKAFAMDPHNLTLVPPRLNRYEKQAKDAAEWLPEKNRCWFAGRVIAVREKYDLTIDQCEHDTLKTVVQHCESMALE